MKNIAIIGSSGGIGKAFVMALSNRFPQATIFAFSRSSQGNLPYNCQSHSIDYDSELSIVGAATLAAENGPLDLVVVATGILHDGALMPEKSLRDLSMPKFEKVFAANTILPAMIAKYFLPKLNNKERSVFAALSARVGSVSDNVLGGWYAYRASKAALNMILKNAAIEIKRRNKHAIVVGLHPGTVDSTLSEPFQISVPEGKLFTPEYSVSCLLTVLDGLNSNDTGRCFAWDGKEVLP